MSGRLPFNSHELLLLFRFEQAMTELHPNGVYAIGMHDYNVPGISCGAELALLVT